MAADNMVWNITKDKVVERIAVSTDDAWSVAGAKAPPAPPKAGTVPDPMTDFIKEGRWQPAIEAQGDLVKEFKKSHKMK